MFDLSELKQSDTAEMKVRHPKTGDETGWIITFAGPGHEKAIRLKNSQIARGMKRARLGTDVDDVLPEELEQQSIDFIVGRIVGWEGLTWEGQPKAFDADFAKKLLGDPAFEWLKNACNRFVAADQNFIGGSPKA